jgi:hypothetical protein
MCRQSALVAAPALAISAYTIYSFVEARNMRRRVRYALLRNVRSSTVQERSDLSKESRD